jgi:hypothetical protein
MPPAAEIEAWVQRHHRLAGDRAGQLQWAAEFRGWCRERGVNPAAAIRFAAAVKMLEAQADA